MKEENSKCKLSDFLFLPLPLIQDACNAGKTQIPNKEVRSKCCTGNCDEDSFYLTSIRTCCLILAFSGSRILKDNLRLTFITLQSLAICH